MPSVSAELYEVLSLGARYVFVFLGFLIVLRSYRWLIADHLEKRRRLRRLPDAGMIGELTVLSGSPALPENTVIPVPREGVLGSVRSCDIVVPCSGVRKQHLDFSWSDTGAVLIRPRSGREVQVDGVLLNVRTDPTSAPLRQGSILQVGRAVLRLGVFAGLDPGIGDPLTETGSSPFGEPHSSFPPLPADPSAISGSDAFPAYPPVSSQGLLPSGGPQVDSSPPDPFVCGSVDDPAFCVQPSARVPDTDASASELSPVPAPVRRRSDRFKEDWSE